MKYALLFLAVMLGLPAMAQERVPGAEQHVTVPSAPGQSNKEALVLEECDHHPRKERTPAAGRACAPHPRVPGPEAG